MTRILLTVSILLAGQALFAVDMPVEWDFGSRPGNASFGYSFTITNTAPEDVRVSAIVTCDCLLIVPSELTLAPGKSRKVRVSLDPTGYSGAITRWIVFRLQGAETANRMFAVKGTILGTDSSSSTATGCATCRIREEERSKPVGTQR